MSLRCAIALFLGLLAVVLASHSCSSLEMLLGSTPTPPPGWRSLLSEILLDDDELPPGWERGRDWPRSWGTDPRINHVFRDWWNAARGTPGSVDQHIWRAYTEEAAKDRYRDLRESDFDPVRPREGELYLKFVPPPGFGSASAIADEDYFACGWYEISFCVFIARYRNYVTEVRFEMEEEYQGQISNGISLRDAYEVVFAVDAEFADFLVRLDATEVP